MASKTFSAPGLRLKLQEGAEETVVYCSGKITAESAETFQSEIHDHVIPMTRGKGVTVTTRLVLDLSNVTFVDSTGLGALFSLWSAAQSKSCELEIVNLNPRLQKLVGLTRLDQVFHRVKGLFNGE